MSRSMPEATMNRLREWRQLHNLTSTALATKVGTTSAQITRLETEERTLTFVWARRLAKALNITPGELMSAHDNPLLPSPDERDLLIKIRAGGEQLKRTIEAIIDAQQCNKN